MHSLTVGKKMAVTCGLLVACVAILAAVSLRSTYGLQAKFESLRTDSIPGLYYASAIEGSIAKMRFSMNAYLIDIATNHGQNTAKWEQSLQRAEGELQQALAGYEKYITLDEDRRLFNGLKPQIAELKNDWAHVSTVRREGKPEAEIAQVFRAEVVELFLVLDKATTNLMEFNHRNAVQTADDASSAAAYAIWLAWLISLGAIVSGCILAVAMVRGINGVLRKVAADLLEGASQSASAAAQVASASQQLAQGASEQAASLEETSATSEEINSLTQRNTDSSKTAAELATQVSRQVVVANKALDEMVVSMNQIKTSSDSISKIIKVIDEIAFQTNILALNAAVEAARAGEAGMGFAVVADEVRNLAQRCAQAAKDTSAMIEDSIQRSSEGKSKLNDVASAIHSITESAGRVETLANEVNMGSQEQSRGIEQVTKAVTQMEKVTQQTAASAEESASAAEELNAQTDALRDVIHRLNVMVGMKRLQAA